MYKAVFEKLVKITDIAALSKEDRMMYDESLKVYWDYLVTIEGAVEEGMAKGMEERITVARNMKSRGMPIELIADITQVPLKELEKL